MAMGVSAPYGTLGARPRHSVQVCARTAALAVERCSAPPTVRIPFRNFARMRSWRQTGVVHADNTCVKATNAPVLPICEAKEQSNRTRTSWLKHGSRANCRRNCHKLTSKSRCAGCVEVCQGLAFAQPALQLLLVLCRTRTGAVTFTARD